MCKLHSFIQIKTNLLLLGDSCLFLNNHRFLTFQDSTRPSHSWVDQVFTVIVCTECGPDCSNSAP